MTDWKKVWDEWDIRGFIILSLSLQAILVLPAPLRKRTGNKFVAVPLWLAYLLADWVATLAVGLIAKGQGRHERSGAFANPDYLLAFWASFLLVHLGGPDTITAFAIEDNTLWQRHTLQLISQSLLVGYVFVFTLTTSHKNLLVATVLIFVSGLIKYIERTYSLYLASSGRFRKTLLSEPDPGPNYAKLMDEYFSKKEAKLPTTIEIIPEPLRVNEIADLTELEAMNYAFQFSKTFKGLVGNVFFNFSERSQSRDFFLKRTAKDAFKVVEIELNFFYEILYTKSLVTQSWLGYVLRFISLSSGVVALIMFFLMEKKGVNEVDVIITYSLLGGGIAFDTIAFLMLMFSDWTAVALTKSKDPSCVATFFRKVLFVDRQRWIDEDLMKPCPFRLRLVLRLLPVLHGRWSESMFQYNLIHYCLQPRPKRKEKFIGLLGLTHILDGWKYVKTKPFTKGLRNFIFNELRVKSDMADELDIAKEISSAKGDWVLRMEGCDTLLPYSAEANYDESLLLWHIATDLCYNSDHKGNEMNNEFREFSKVLSDYMLYLLIMNPKLMSAVAGIGEIRFRDTCAEAKKFFRGRKIGKKQEQKESCLNIPCVDKCLCCRKPEEGQEQRQANWEPNVVFCFKKCCCKEKAGPDEEHILACKSILAVNTEVVPVTVKGDRSKSVLFDACVLAKELNELEEEKKWKIISKVWVELLSNAACHCSADTHVAQLSQGGQLITVVWLLMTQLGLGEHFQKDRGYARARIILGK